MADVEKKTVYVWSDCEVHQTEVVKSNPASEYWYSRELRISFPGEEVFTSQSMAAQHGIEALERQIAFLQKYVGKAKELVG